jgi:SAM-dependent methyltransferase
MAEDLDLRIAEGNAAQVAAWDGDEGAYWAAHADRYDRAVEGYHHTLLDAAAIAGADRVLDIGCGTGQTTRDAARLASSGSALGVDLSSRMLEVARRRAAAEDVPNARFEQADAQEHRFEPGYDVALSRTGTMFFGDPDAAFANIAAGLRPGGRLTLLTWQSAARNEWILELAGALAVGRDLPLPPPDAPGPFSQSDPDRLRDLLAGAGFAEQLIAPVSADMWFGADADDACRFVLGQLGWMLEGLDEAGRAAADQALRETLAAHTGSDGVRFGSAAWLTTAVRL